MSAVQEKKVCVWEELVTIPTYQAAAPEKNPLFIENRVYQGSSGKVYPFPVTEKISDEKTDVDYHAVFLENEYLKIMILPELGGRIQRALDKTNNYDFIYYNHVIKPALVGLTGPWISGGIEFNWPQHHRPTTFSPVNYTYCSENDGSATVFLGETDRMYGTQELTKITLYPGKAYIEIKGQVYNPTDFPQTFLWWANPAVPVNDYTFSVFPPDVSAVMDHGKRAVSSFPVATGEYYKYDYSAGIDISRYKNIKVPTSYMAAHSDYDFMGNFDENIDAGLLHIADHHISPGKKQWTWGCGDFGRMWDRNLTDDDGPYIELMTGVYTDNQPDFTWLKPQEEKSFTQYFLPYKGVGRVGNATRDAAVTFELTKDRTLQIFAYVTAAKENCCIRLTKNDAVIYERTESLSPENCFKDSIKDFTHSLTGCNLSISCNGSELVSYDYYEKKPQPVPKPAEAIPEPGAIQTTEDYYLSALHLEQYRHATFDPASYYEAGLMKDKSDIRLNNAYGVLLMKRGETGKALMHFKEAVKKQVWKNPNPYYGDAYLNLGIAFDADNKDSDAYDAFYKSVWNMETQVSGYYLLACICCRRKEYVKALDFINEALIRNNHSMNALVLKAALLRILKKDNTERLAHMNHALLINPLEMGLLYEQGLVINDFQQFKRLIRNEPNNYLSLIVPYFKAGLWNDILNLLHLSCMDYPVIHYLQGYAYAMSGNRAQMIACYRKGESANSDYCFPNRPEEYRILKHVTENLENASMAHYYLGNLLYDKKQYDSAVYHWETSLKFNENFSMAWRNLALAYFNKQQNREKAYDCMVKACAYAPDNLRFHLEFDQLAETIQISPGQRLKKFKSLSRQTLTSRDDLYLRYISLLNFFGYYEEALKALSEHHFHPWEGGEGKVSTQYRFALCRLAFRLYKNRHDKNACADWSVQAINLLKRSLYYPPNLGEGKLPNAQDNQAYYYMGVIYDSIGDNEKACENYTKAALGNSEPSCVLYYNDLPSDYIFYQGLAYIKLNNPEKARGCFHRLKAFGEVHIFDKISFDYFAVSLPELDIFQTDFQLKNTVYCKYLTALGNLGLENTEKASELFKEILTLKPDHLQAAAYLQAID